MFYERKCTIQSYMHVYACVYVYMCIPAIIHINGKRYTNTHTHYIYMYIYIYISYLTEVRVPCLFCMRNVRAGAQMKRIFYKCTADIIHCPRHQGIYLHNLPHRITCTLTYSQICTRMLKVKF